MRHRVHVLSGDSPVPGSVHSVVIPGASAGGPSVLAEPLISVLIDVESRGLNIILHAYTPADLKTPVAQVCRQVRTNDPETTRVAVKWWGREQVRSHFSRMAVPESRTFRRRVYNIVKRRGA